MPISAPTTPNSRGVKPEWKNLPRERCDNCPKIYKPKQPRRKNPDGSMQHGFCSQECKKQFHKHGSAFIQLKRAMESEMKAMEKRFREIVREEMANATTYSATGERGRICPEGSIPGRVRVTLPEAS